MSFKKLLLLDVIARDIIASSATDCLSKVAQKYEQSLPDIVFHFSIPVLCFLNFCVLQFAAKSPRPDWVCG